MLYLFGVVNIFVLSYILEATFLVVPGKFSFLFTGVLKMDGKYEFLNSSLSSSLLFRKEGWSRNSYFNFY